MSIRSRGLGHDSSGAKSQGCKSEWSGHRVAPRDTLVLQHPLATELKPIFSAANLQWVVNAYTLIFGGFLLLGGRAADLIGRKRLFMAGIALFSLASLLNGLAQSPTMLIVGRGLQGLGAALLSPAALSIITTTFTETGERTRALGVWSAIAAGGGAVGLVLGGALTQLASWEWIFIVNVPVGIATILATLRYVPESRADVQHRTFDLAGAVTHDARAALGPHAPEPAAERRAW